MRRRVDTGLGGMWHRGSVDVHGLADATAVRALCSARTRRRVLRLRLRVPQRVQLRVRVRVMMRMARAVRPIRAFVSLPVHLLLLLLLLFLLLLLLLLVLMVVLLLLGRFPLAAAGWMRLGGTRG